MIVSLSDLKPGQCFRRVESGDLGYPKMLIEHGMHTSTSKGQDRHLICVVLHPRDAWKVGTIITISRAAKVEPLTLTQVAAIIEEPATFSNDPIAEAEALLK